MATMTTTASGTIIGYEGLANRASTSANGNAIHPATRRRRIAVGKLGAFNNTSTPGAAINEIGLLRLRRQASRIRIAVAVVPPIPTTYTVRKATVTRSRTAAAS